MRFARQSAVTGFRHQDFSADTGHQKLVYTTMLVHWSDEML
jgi:hypothetical protein